jgi:hypothetical protein
MACFPGLRLGRTGAADGDIPYEWWPILRERNLYRHLATAEVVVKRIDGDRDR